MTEACPDATKSDAGDWRDKNPPFYPFGARWVAGWPRAAPAIRWEATPWALSPRTMMNVSPHRAVIAEDNALVARALGAVLRGLGFEVTIVADGDEARQLVFADPPDLLIADIGLSRVGGSSLIRWLKATRHDAKVVAISGIGEEGRELALAAGADAFLAKPFRLDELEQVIRELVQAP